jgi:hypothetical protein
VITDVVRSGDENCPAGGQRIRTGLDDNQNQVLEDPEEVDQVSFVCNGLPGAQGQPGLQGEDGAQGVDGQDGVQGDPGQQGIQGIQGLQGDRGLQGLQGDKGQDGAPGQQGDSGTTQIVEKECVFGTGQYATLGCSSDPFVAGANETLIIDFTTSFCLAETQEARILGLSSSFFDLTDGFAGSFSEAGNVASGFVGCGTVQDSVVLQLTEGHIYLLNHDAILNEISFGSGFSKMRIQIVNTGPRP